MQGILSQYLNHYSFDFPSLRLKEEISLLLDLRRISLVQEFRGDHLFFTSSVQVSLNPAVVLRLPSQRNQNLDKHEPFHSGIFFGCV